MDDNYKVSSMINGVDIATLKKTIGTMILSMLLPVSNITKNNFTFRLESHLYWLVMMRVLIQWSFYLVLCLAA
ncbi:hypothetical protein [Legionella pneumophila]|uniref:hypothetical protein n=1 Tax=Legionella pneumophila TaxID=446 RepID=UPI00353193FE